MLGPFDQGWRRIVIAASGPSFTVEQAEQIEAARVAGLCRVIAINTTALTKMQTADALYVSDGQWWAAYGMQRAFPAEISAREFVGQKWTQDKPSADTHGAHFVKRELFEGLTRKPDAINGGGNSGYAAVNLAYLFGACCIALVGFDMKYQGKRTHHHGDHPGSMANPSEAALKTWAQRFDKLARDLDAANVGVVNCTISTALVCFPRADLAEVLECWQ